MADMVRKVVIPAAGLGTRFLPITKAQPKEMLPVVDKPVIQYVVEEAVASGIDDIIIITGRNKRAIEDHFDRCIEWKISFHQIRGSHHILMWILLIFQISIIYGSVNQRGLGMQFFLRKSIVMMSHLSFCSEIR